MSVVIVLVIYQLLVYHDDLHCTHVFSLIHCDAKDVANLLSGNFFPMLNF